MSILTKTLSVIYMAFLAVLEILYFPSQQFLFQFTIIAEEKKHNPRGYPPSGDPGINLQALGKKRI